MLPGNLFVITVCTVLILSGDFLLACITLEVHIIITIVEGRGSLNIAYSKGIWEIDSCKHHGLLSSVLYDRFHSTLNWLGC